MLILGLDTCCMPATAAVCDGEKIVAEALLNCGKTHSQRIMPQLSDLLGAAEIDCGDIDCFAAAIGPGSFTGVRIGVATIKALAHGCGKPCVAVSTLEGLAYNVPYFNGIICPILDARRNQVYTALFNGGEIPERITEDRAIALDNLLCELLEYDKDVLFLGDGIFVYKDYIKEKLGDKAKFAMRNLNMNMAGSIASIAASKYEKGETVSYQDLIPQYIRLSQAERERLEKQNS